jgi:hypothetical protein
MAGADCSRACPTFDDIDPWEPHSPYLFRNINCSREFLKDKIHELMRENYRTQAISMQVLSSVSTILVMPETDALCHRGEVAMKQDDQCPGGTRVPQR